MRVAKQSPKLTDSGFTKQTQEDTQQIWAEYYRLRNLGAAQLDCHADCSLCPGRDEQPPVVEIEYSEFPRPIGSDFLRDWAGRRHLCCAGLEVGRMAMPSLRVEIRSAQTAFI